MLPQDSTPRAPALDSHSENLETKYELKCSDTRVDASSSTLLTSSDPIIGEPSLGKANQMPGPVEADDVPVANPLLRHPPSPHVAQFVPAKEPGMSVSLATVSSSTSRSPSQQPLSVPSPVKDERSESPADILISALVPPETPRRSLEPENASEQAMVDVEEELLGLVEDRPVPTSSKIRVGSRSLLPIMAGQSTAVGARQGPNEVSDGPSLVLSSHHVPKGPLMTDEEKDRASMPPPAARKKAEKDKTAPLTATAGSKKKKEGTSKVRTSHPRLRPTSPQALLSLISPAPNQNRLQNHEPSPLLNLKPNQMS